MINNLAPKSRGPDDPIYPILRKGLAEGVAGGVMSFIKVNNIQVKNFVKGERHPFHDFVELILTEWGEQPPKVPFPFEGSLKEDLAKRVAEETTLIEVLYRTGQLEELNGVLHCIGGAAVLEFLDARRIQALTLLNQLISDKK